MGKAPGRTPGPALCRSSRLWVKLTTTCVRYAWARMWSKWGGSHARMLSVPPRLGVWAAGVWAAAGVGDVSRAGRAAATRPVAPAASRARRESRVSTLSTSGTLGGAIGHMS
jgi:hypothetical protein